MEKIAHLKARIAKMKSRNKDNRNVLNCLEKELRKLEFARNDSDRA